MSQASPFQEDKLNVLMVLSDLKMFVLVSVLLMSCAHDNHPASLVFLCD